LIEIAATDEIPGVLGKFYEYVCKFAATPNEISIGVAGRRDRRRPCARAA